MGAMGDPPKMIPQLFCVFLNISIQKQTNMTKIKLLVYSLCQGHQIIDHLKTYPNFEEIYESKCLPNYSFRFYGGDYGYAIESIKQADIIIYQPVGIKNGPWSTDELLKNKKPECRLIKIPNIYNNAFFPLCKLGEYMGSKLFGEESIIQLIAQGLNYNQIVVKYNTNQIDWKFKERFEALIQRARDEEASSDIKYVDYIIDNHHDLPLFTDSIHPTKVVIVYLANQVMDLLQVQGLKQDPKLFAEQFDSANQNTPGTLFYNFKWMANFKHNDSLYINLIKDICNGSIDQLKPPSTEYTF